MRVTPSIVVLVLTSSLYAEPIRVIPTGDSLTSQYTTYGFLRAALNAASMDAVAPDLLYDHVGNVATYRGGLWSDAYVGNATWPGEGPINYGSNVLAADPDVILFMLGINDVPFNCDQNGLAARFQHYQDLIAPVFDNFASFTNSHVEHPHVIIGSVLPFDVDKTEGYLSAVRGYPVAYPPGTIDFLGNTWNPWLASKSLQHGFTYIDNFTALQQVPDWKNTMMDPNDGLHLSVAGCQWIASRFVSAIAVPTPSTWESNADGIWSSPGNWSTGVPSGPGATARFVGASPATVNVDCPVTVGQIVLDAGAAETNYTISGCAITLDNTDGTDGEALIDAESGVHTISAPIVLGDDATIAGSGALILSGGIAGNHALTVLTDVMATSIQVDSLTIGAMGVTAVPEPGSLALLLTMAACGAFLWRRREA
jgi:lysophospholipase L1-like esterase